MVTMTPEQRREVALKAATDLSTRFNDHHQANCFTKNKANCIRIHRDDEDSRLAKESDLMKRHNPDCNN